MLYSPGSALTNAEPVLFRSNRACPSLRRPAGFSSYFPGAAGFEKSTAGAVSEPGGASYVWARLRGEQRADRYGAPRRRRWLRM